MHYLNGSTAPMFLNTSDAESPEYRRGLEQLANRLRAAEVDHVYQVDADRRGHRVSTSPPTLKRIYSFFRERLAGVVR